MQFYYQSYYLVIRYYDYCIDKQCLLNWNLSVFLFLFLFCFTVASDSQINTVIVQMLGSADGGFNFLKPAQQERFNFDRRNHKPFNQEQAFHEPHYLRAPHKTVIYTNNLSIQDMDLGGHRCVEFYRAMILYAHKTYPNARIILAGTSQGSVSPIGALAQLAQENHPVIPYIDKVLIQAILGSTHETINFHVQKIPILKILPYLSDKIVPLIAEYFLGLVPGFARYNAFAPQMYHYIKQLNTQANIDHIKFLMLHDTLDPIIPCSCAHKAIKLLKKNKKYLETTINPSLYFKEADLKKHEEKFRHIPTNGQEGTQAAVNFIYDAPIANECDISDQKTFEPDTFFINRTPLERFIIRRIRDACTLATFFVAYKGIRLILWSIKIALKNLYYS